MHAISTETSVVERWGECQMLRIAVHGCQQLCLGVGTMAPANCSFGLQRPANRLQYSFFIHTEDVLFLRAQGQHADAPAEDDETILLVGRVEAAPLGLDAHRQISAGGADVNEQSLACGSRRGELQERDGMHRVASDRDENRRCLLVVDSLLIVGSFKQGTCFLALLGIVTDPHVNTRSRSDQFLQGSASNCSVSFGLLHCRNLRLLQQEGLSTNKRFVLRRLACGVLFEVLSSEFGDLPVASFARLGLGPGSLFERVIPVQIAKSLPLRT
mmetsp:Transcript_37015/g.80399  ORF Transcript_37015/g.80399 Transcript_37015/m.80399 type:complete len:271 (-) Transcript_37015:109-921(-)